MSPAPIIDLTTSPNWTDIGGFIVALVGTAATAIIAAVALVVTMKTNSFNKHRAEADVAERKRSRRAVFAVDLVAWNQASTVHLLTAGALLVGDDAFVATGDRLSAEAKILDEPGAFDFLSVQRELRDWMGRTKIDDLDLLARANQAKFDDLVRRWVDEPSSAAIEAERWWRDIHERDLTLPPSGQATPQQPRSPSA